MTHVFHRQIAQTYPVAAMLAPPFIVEAADIDTIVERLGDAVDAALAAAA